MKKILLCIFLFYIHVVTYGSITWMDSVSVSISFCDKEKRELYIEMKDGDITIKADTVISYTQKKDMEKRLLYVEKKECKLIVPERISQYLKKTIRDLFISHNQTIYRDSIRNVVFDQESDCILEANIQKNNGERHELYMPLLDYSMEKHIKYSSAFTEFINTLRDLLSISISIEGFPVLEKTYTTPLCAESYDMVKLKFEGLPNWIVLDITATPTSVICSAEAPFDNPNETKYYGNTDIICYHTFMGNLSFSEEKYIKAAVNDFFITKSLPMYSINSKVADGSYEHDVSTTAINLTIYYGNCTKQVDMPLASAYNISTKQIENYKIRYSDQFMRFLQFLSYLRARSLGGEFHQWYRQDIGHMKGNPKYHVYEFESEDSLSKRIQSPVHVKQ